MNGVWATGENRERGGVLVWVVVCVCKYVCVNWGGWRGGRRVLVMQSAARSELYIEVATKYPNACGGLNLFYLTRSAIGAAVPPVLR